MICATWQQLVCNTAPHLYNLQGAHGDVHSDNVHTLNKLLAVKKVMIELPASSIGIISILYIALYLAIHCSPDSTSPYFWRLAIVGCKCVPLLK